MVGQASRLFSQFKLFSSFYGGGWGGDLTITSLATSVLEHCLFDEPDDEEDEETEQEQVEEVIPAMNTRTMLVLSVCVPGTTRLPKANRSLTITPDLKNVARQTS